MKPWQNVLIKCVDVSAAFVETVDFCFVWRIWLPQFDRIYFAVLFKYCFLPPFLLFCSLLFLLSACAHQTRYRELAVALDSSNLNEQAVRYTDRGVGKKQSNQPVWRGPRCSSRLFGCLQSYGFSPSATRKAAYTALCREQNELHGKPVKGLKV